MKLRRQISLLLALCLLFALVPNVWATDPTDRQPYDPQAAAAYAVEHWNDGRGQCAQFVCTCLAAGGIIVPNQKYYYNYYDLRYWKGDILSAFTNPYICAPSLLLWLSERYEIVEFPRNEDIEIGDVIFIHTTNPDGHTAIITGFDGDEPLFTAHNWATCNEPLKGRARFLAKVAPREPAICDKEEDCAGNQFLDMPQPEDWSHPYIDFVYENGLFSGTDVDLFSPNETMTRAMLVTVLWRLQGKPTGYDHDFVDVAAGEWYEEPIAWAYSTGIVSGEGEGRFAPDEPVLREDAATILLRYAATFGGASLERADFSKFQDGDKVSPWATDGLQWAVQTGLIAGDRNSDGGLWLYPGYTATRAELAAILTRFVQMTPPTEEEKDSLSALRAAALEQGYDFALGNIGYSKSISSFLDSRDAAPYRIRCGFLWELPETSYVQQPGSELYCIVPTDGTASVTVYALDENGTCGQVLYQAADGSPIIVQGNVSDIMPNLLVELTTATGTLRFSPYLSLKDGSLCAMGAEDAFLDLKNYR